MNNTLKDILVCPVCNGPLIFVDSDKEMICKVDRLAFPIVDDIPVMLESEARILSPDEEVKPG